MIGGKDNIPIKKYIVRKKISKNSKTHKYYNQQGKQISKTTGEKYSKSLGIAIPPAYPVVIISLNKNVKLLALGTDDKGRKQYFYNTKFTIKKTQEKYCHLIHLGQIFPDLQRDIAKSLKTQNLNSNSDIFNLMLWLIINCHFRIGSESMKDQYGTTGVCTIHRKHIQFLTGSKMKIEFIGKKNVVNKCIVDNKAVIRFMRKILSKCKSNCRIFEITMQNGTKKFAEHTDLNQYLNDKAGVTAKEFRTWMANVLFLKYLDEHKLSTDTNERKKQIKTTIEKVADDLHHTPAICKKSYLLSEMLDSITDNTNNWNHNNNNVKALYKKNRSRYSVHEWRFISYLFKSCRTTKLNL